VPAVSVVIPVFRDTVALQQMLACTDFSGAEVIVAATRDDGAAFAPLRVAHPAVVWVESAQGRATQMNAGAARATARWLLFLHADTRLPLGWQEAIARADGDPRVAIGCFRFALDSPAWMARVVEWGVRLRMRWLHLPYGDQALFVRRAVFDAVGGYPDVPIMEDVELVRLARRHGRLLAVPIAVVTSARRWEQQGWLRRSLLNLALILLYKAGMRPAALIRLDRARRTHPPQAAGRIYL
jgi:rSAM/selenodomain-associated transferase 2